jgi:hypothetical protein
MNNLGLTRFARIGSFGNGTSISGYSDVDYLAVLPSNQVTPSSTYSLTKVRDVLANRFPFTGVRVGCPAIVVPFGTSIAETTEVVPGDYRHTKDGYKVYEIADCSGGWMKASPDAHNNYVRAIDEKLNRKVRPLIRFAKAWKYFRDVPLSSFYLELRIAKYASSEKYIVYDWDLRNIFKMLLDSELSSLQDPMGVSGYIPAASTEIRRRDALSKVETAFIRAEKARAAAGLGDVKVAFEWWDLVFANQFPSYYYS